MREIIEEESYLDAVVTLGGHQKVDIALDTVIHSLMRNPFAFKLFDSVYTSFRYVITREATLPDGRRMPPLVVAFTISSEGNVHLKNVEIFEPGD